MSKKSLKKARKERTHVFLISKVVKGKTIADALRKERKGRIVDITLTHLKSKGEQLESAIGFSYQPTGNELDDDE